LKKAANVINIPLTMMFRKSLDEGEFPTDWKLATQPFLKKVIKHNLAVIVQ